MAMRDIDIAMAETRPAKQAIRLKWLEVCKEWRTKSNHEPLYVTLPGSDGYDIAMLIEAGLLEVLENNAVADNAAGLVVAVEKDMVAAGALRARFPGLKVVPKDIGEELKIQRPIVDLSKDAKKYGCGLVINLDFNQPLLVANNGHPVLELVDRLSDIHKYPAVQDWTLLLTLNTNTDGWPPNVCVRHAKTLVEILAAEAEFYGWWQKYCGDLGPVEDGEMVFSAWPAKQQQCLILALVPLLVLRRLAATGWDTTVRSGAIYGERDAGQAAMCTWILDVSHDPDICAQPDAQRRRFIQLLLAAVGYLGADGAWSSLT